jgi:hypothetical protein
VVNCSSSIGCRGNKKRKKERKKEKIDKKEAKEDRQESETISTSKQKNGEMKVKESNVWIKLHCF